MPRNFSEWAKRIFQVVLAVAAIAGIVDAWNSDPHVWLTYQIQAPGALPAKVERCGDDDVREYFYRDGPDGTRFNIDLCFKTVQKNRLKFIPYATDEDGISWIELKNSPQVGAHTRAVARAFVVPQEDYDAALALWHKGKQQARLERLAEVAVSLAVFCMLGILAGWILRKLLNGALRKHARRIS
jgi:hypothetical protein